MCVVLHTGEEQLAIKNVVSQVPRSRFRILFAFVSQVYFRALLVINWVKNLNKMASVLFFLSFFFCLLFGIHLSYRVVILHLTHTPPTHTHSWLAQQWTEGGTRSPQLSVVAQAVSQCTGICELQRDNLHAHHSSTLRRTASSFTLLKPLCQEFTFGLNCIWDVLFFF